MLHAGRGRYAQKERCRWALPDSTGGSHDPGGELVPYRRGPHGLAALLRRRLEASADIHGGHGANGGGVADGHRGDGVLIYAIDSATPLPAGVTFNAAVQAP